jgi:hypothetical protein
MNIINKPLIPFIFFKEFKVNIKSDYYGELVEIGKEFETPKVLNIMVDELTQVLIDNDIAMPLSEWREKQINSILED